jgi:hypothetical protein
MGNLKTARLLLSHTSTAIQVVPNFWQRFTRLDPLYSLSLWPAAWEHSVLVLMQLDLRLLIKVMGACRPLEHDLVPIYLRAMDRVLIIISHWKQIIGNSWVFVGQLLAERVPVASVLRRFDYRSQLLRLQVPAALSDRVGASGRSHGFTGLIDWIQLPTPLVRWCYINGLRLGWLLIDGLFNGRVLKLLRLGS